MEAPIRVDDPFLTECVSVLERRRKALRHRNAVLELDKIIELEGDGSNERLDLLVRKSRRQALRLSLWDDRKVWIDAREAVKEGGWRFEFQDSGRLSGDVSGRDLVEAIEASLAAMFEMSAGNVSKLKGIWSPLIAKGPRSI